MKFYKDILLPKILDKMLSNPEIDSLRHKAVQNATGTVLEIGLGTGLTLPHYSSQVHTIYALDPQSTVRKLANSRSAIAKKNLIFLDYDGNNFNPIIPQNSIDCIVSSFSMCTVPNPVELFQRISRFLKPNAKLYFLEHGLAPEPEVAKWQDRLNGFQKCVFDGCNLNRSISSLIEESRFKILDMTNLYIKGPKAMSYMYLGSAAKLD